jgi:hypothetical protein
MLAYLNKQVSISCLLLCTFLSTKGAYYGANYLCLLISISKHCKTFVCLLAFLPLWVKQALARDKKASARDRRQDRRFCFATANKKQARDRRQDRSNYS